MAVDPTKLTWTRNGEASLVARSLVWAALALGQMLLLWAQTWDWGKGPWVALAAASSGMSVLGSVTWGPTRQALTAWRAFGRVMGVTLAVTIVGFWTFVLGALASSDLGEGVISALIVGVVWGLLTSAVVVPLSLVIHRWRTDPALHRSLDLAVALIAVTALFSLARPRGLADAVHACFVDSAQLSMRIHCEAVPVGRLLARFGDALLSSALAMAVGLWAWEWRLRRWLDDARLGQVPGYRAVAARSLSTDGLPQWTLGEEPCAVALVRDRPEDGYRDNATDRPVAVLPADERVAWREYVLPMVVLVCSLGLWARLGG